MGSWKQYVFSLIICALSCGLVSQIISDTKRKALMHLISGTVLAICILQPLSELNLEDFMNVPLFGQNTSVPYIADGEKTALEAQAGFIKATCEAYILDKANTLGAEITPQVSLNKELVPVFVEIKGDVAPDAELELQKILMTDLGIPKENQKWTWNQESNSS